MNSAVEKVRQSPQSTEEAINEKLASLKVENSPEIVNLEAEARQLKEELGGARQAEANKLAELESARQEVERARGESEEAYRKYARFAKEKLGLDVTVPGEEDWSQH